MDGLESAGSEALTHRTEQAGEILQPALVSPLGGELEVVDIGICDIGRFTRIERRDGFGNRVLRRVLRQLDLDWGVPGLELLDHCQQRVVLTFVESLDPPDPESFLRRCRRGNRQTNDENGAKRKGQGFGFHDGYLRQGVGFVDAPSRVSSASYFATGCTSMATGCIFRCMPGRCRKQGGSRHAGCPMQRARATDSGVGAVYHCPAWWLNPQAADGLRAGPAVYGMWRAGGGACRYGHCLNSNDEAPRFPALNMDTMKSSAAPPTMQQVARAAGVARSTVSRAFT